MEKTGSFDTLIVYCHPWEGSFTHAVLEAAERGLDRRGRSHELIDLYADGFEPAMRREELAGYSRGKVLVPLVAKYQDQLSCCHRLLLIFPIWWNDVPAMLRGWLDKVMLPGFSWEATGHGLQGTLQHIERVDAYTTSANATQYMQERLGDGIQKTLLDATFWQLGCGKGCWHNLGSMDLTTADERNAWLSQVEEDMAGC